MIKILEEMIRRSCAYGFELKDSDEFTHNWCTLIPSLELEYETSIHSSRGQTPSILEKGWNPRLPEDTLRKDLVEIHPKASSSKLILDKAKSYERTSMDYDFEYAKRKWEKSHKVQEFKVAEFFLVSTINLNNIEGPKKLEDYYLEHFVIVS
ncbi:hypothetical protein O181_039648 [Austropuccinia psidii MF-1]|uniref:Uncharacterized protein n=1 Tax=Austropuccinia psidii MF-1 TaxID=1389203 RepID=A0A9Q3DFP3_9BASI|nr:hypothetical protein [Austropuccinia psidii MF-1]